MIVLRKLQNICMEEEGGKIKKMGGLSESEETRAQMGGGWEEMGEKGG